MSDSDCLFRTAEPEHIVPVNIVVWAGAGVSKRVRSFDPDPVMVLPPALDEWLREFHMDCFKDFNVRSSMQGRLIPPAPKRRVSCRMAPNILSCEVVTTRGQGHSSPVGAVRYLPQRDETPHHRIANNSGLASSADSVPGDLARRPRPPHRAPTGGDTPQHCPHFSSKPQRKEPTRSRPTRPSTPPTATNRLAQKTIQRLTTDAPSRV